jgi:anti-anti-sigma factor
MPGPEDYGLVVRKFEGVIIIEFTEVRILDQLQIERIKEYVIKLANAAGQPKVIMSFQGVASISSAVIGVVIALNKACVEKHGELRLAGLSPDILTVFKLTRLDKMVKIYRSTEEAQLKF